MKSKNDGDYLFPMERIIEVLIFQRKGRFYVRTRDIADLLCIKQPFEFCADIKRFLGSNCILKGEEAAFIYGKDGSQSRTTYINISHMIKYLCSPYSPNNKMKQKKAVINALKQIQKEKENFFIREEIENETKY